MYARRFNVPKRPLERGALERACAEHLGAVLEESAVLQRLGEEAMLRPAQQQSGRQPSRKCT